MASALKRSESYHVYISAVCVPCSVGMQGSLDHSMQHGNILVLVVFASLCCHKTVTSSSEGSSTVCSQKFLLRTALPVPYTQLEHIPTSVNKKFENNSVFKSEILNEE
jgi:hypothetical protein